MAKSRKKTAQQSKSNSAEILQGKSPSTLSETLNENRTALIFFGVVFLAIIILYKPIVFDGLDSSGSDVISNIGNTKAAKDFEKQRRHYSGKKKRHTLKNTLVVEPEQKKILILTSTTPGSVHDKKDLDDNDIVPHIPKEIPIELDLGYKGLEKEYQGIIIPHKKPRKGELTETQKQQNREIASSRIRGEHAIGLCKRYRCVSDVFRNRREGFDDAVMFTCCGLANFYQRTKKRA